LAEAYFLSRRPNGWILLGGWAPAPGGHKVRIVVQQAPGNTALLENMYLVDVPSLREPAHPTRHGDYSRHQ